MAATDTIAGSVDSVPVAKDESQESRVATVAGRALYGALLFVLVMTPFEIGYPPLGRILWTYYTNLEASLFLLGAAWLAVMLVDGRARRRFFRLPLLLPVVALVVAMALSTLLGEYRSLGVQSIYRLLMGVLVLAAAWEALRKPHRLVWALLVVAAAASVSALLGLLEYAPWFNVQPWLQVFKPQATTVGGMLRLSGTFEYANGAAAYFELVTPLLLGLIIVFSSGHALSGIEWQWPTGWKRRALQVGLYVALALCVMSLLLTFSRAAWLGVGLGLVVMAGGLWLRRASFTADFKSPAWRALGLAMLVMLLGTVWVFATQPLFRLRMLGENDREWYKNTIIAGEVPALTEGITVTVPVTVRNDGPVTWQAERAPVVNLSYHWREPGKPDYTIFEGMRTSLPRDVGPGESVTLDAVVWVPPKEGEYLLEWDMVQEHVTWFFQKSRTRSESTLHKVLPAPKGSQVIRPPLSAFPRVNVNEVENYDSSTVARMQLWRVAWAMFKAHPLTGVGPDGFRNLYGPYAGTTSWNRNIYTNSTYIEMFTNLGILGGAAFLWLVGLAMWRGINATLRSPAGVTWSLSLGAMAALVAFLVHGFVDYFLFSTPLYVMFWFVIGIASRREATS